MNIQGIPVVQTRRSETSAWLHELLPYLERFPRIDLTGNQAGQLNGYLFVEGPLLVRMVAAALRDRALFPDVPFDPDEMMGRLGRADDWLRLRELCLELAARADTCHRIAQGTVVRDAMAAVREVRLDAQRLVQGDREALRQAAMIMAEVVLQDWQAGKQRG